MDYQQHAIGAGADARSVAYVEVRVNDAPALFGVGIDVDTTAAAFKAIVAGVQRAEALHSATPGHAAKSQPMDEAVAA